jgi:predicted RNase H-like HicB family nuclease/predicted RNA binding protein YcfA (HicA-like mRNA interferase family)
MGKFEKLLLKLFSGNSGNHFSFEYLEKILLNLGSDKRNTGGSHVIFTKSDIVEIINIQSKGSLAKAYQVKQVRGIVLKYILIKYGDQIWINYWSKEDDSFIAEVPELPGCMADGENYVDVVKNVEIVIEQWIATAKELGREIPIPKWKLMFA